MIEYKEAVWKDDQLHIRGKFVGSVVQDEVYKHMYWPKFANGRKYKDFFNYDRAKDNLVKMYIEKANKQPSISNRIAEKPVS